MRLASDYIHPYNDAGGRPGRCRVWIYLPEDVRDAPVVICSELLNNPGGTVNNSAETIAAGVFRANELPTPLVWIEHWPEETTEGQKIFEPQHSWSASSTPQPSRKETSGDAATTTARAR
jgi:hypothetical protein